MKRRFLTTTETAEQLRRPPETLRYWRHIGTGPRSVKIGRSVLYDEADVEAWIAEQYERHGSGDAESVDGA